MQIHQIQKKNQKSKKRVGRGGKRGTYSGRGNKGQGQRAGRKFQPIIRELIKRYPKLRGYRNNPKGEAIISLNLSALSVFKEGEKVCPTSLLKKRLIGRIGGKTPKVKILGNGTLKHKLVFEDCLFSKKAQEKVK